MKELIQIIIEVLRGPKPAPAFQPVRFPSPRRKK